MVYRALIPYDQPPIIIHPPEAALHLPTVAIVGPSADRPPTLGTRPVPARERGNGGLDTPAAQIATEGLAVIGFIRDQLLRACPRAASPSRHSYGGQGGLRQPAFVRRGRRGVDHWHVARIFCGNGHTPGRFSIDSRREVQPQLLMTSSRSLISTSPLPLRSAGHEAGGAGHGP